MTAKNAPEHRLQEEGAGWQWNFRVMFQVLRFSSSLV